MKKLFNFRWPLAIGIFLLSQPPSQAQRNNVWLLGTIESNSPFNMGYGYCIDFNSCPPIFHKVFLENDPYFRKIHTFSGFFFSRPFVNSFCDTAGQFAFTELLGQHYYNKWGEIYDSSFINNRPDGFANAELGTLVTAGNKTYYLKTFNITYYNNNYKPWSPNCWLTSDSIVICISEFDNSGQLITKNKPIYTFHNGLKKNNCGWQATGALSAKIIDDETIEIFCNALYGENMILHYNLKTGKTINKQSLALDSITTCKYSTLKNKFSVSTRGYKRGLYLYEQDSNLVYNLKTYIDFTKYPAPAKKYTRYTDVGSYCFSPNDSIVYAIVEFEKDTLKQNFTYYQYLVAFNYYNPYKDFKFVKVYDEEQMKKTGMHFFSPVHHLKLGPDGNIYGGSGNKLQGYFKITHPNSVKGFHFEWLPDMEDVNLYWLRIATLDEYKRVEFSSHLTCKGLEMAFNNLCDTQHFKHYRLFLDNGDSLDLSKDWNKQFYKYKNPGKYYVRLKAFSKTGGFIWFGDSVKVLVNTQVNADFGIQKTLGCQWVGYKFTDSSKSGTSKPGFTPYKKWFFGDGHDSLITGPNSHLTYKYTKSGNYSVKLIVNNGYCIDSVIKQNKVLILPAPQPGIIASPIDDCIPFNVGFKCKYNDVLDSAIWESGQGPNIQVKDIQGNFAYTKTGNFLLKQKLYGPSGCITRDSINIGAYALPKADFKALDVCETDSVSFNNLSPEARLYNWKFGDGQNSPKRSPQHFYKIDGKSTTFNVTLVTVVTKACSDSATKAVTINANPDSDFAYSINGRTVDLTAKQTGNTKYRWLLGNGDSSIKTSTSLNYTYANTLVQYTVCLKITNAAGCTSETCKYIDGESTGISHPNSSGILIYPNPNTGKFTLCIEKSEKDFSIEVYNLIGEKIKTLDTAPNKLSYSIDLAVTPGIYIVRVKNGFITFNQKVSISK